MRLRTPLQVARHPGAFDDSTREPSIFNLAQTYRKMKRLDEAIKWYRAALAINPHAASTYAALGFT
jgi:tetratricopeptide (TPR) repeat protein